MSDIERMIDANLNRACEGIRVIEDVARFILNNQLLSKEARTIRHGLRSIFYGNSDFLIGTRDSINDIGLKTSQNTKAMERKKLIDLVSANFKRAEEAIRCIEESLKVKSLVSSLLGESGILTVERLRFKVYSLEKDFTLNMNIFNRRNCLNTDIYGITAEQFSLGRDNIKVVKALIDAGVRIIQYREKEKSNKEKLLQCEKIRQLTKDAGVTFIINDNVDLALLVGADGIHVGQDDLPVDKVRQLVGENMIIGLSTHSAEQAKEAMEIGADYIGVGPIYTTHTKKDVCAAVGLEYLEYAVKNVTIPFVAIGGIKEHNLHEVVQRGAKCVCLVTEIVGAKDIGTKVNNLRRIMI